MRVTEYTVLFHKYFPFVFIDRPMVSSCKFFISLAITILCLYSAGYRKGVPKLLVQSWSEADSLLATATASATSVATIQGVATTDAPRLPATNALKVKQVKDYAACVSGAVRAMMMQEVKDLWLKNVVNVLVMPQAFVLPVVLLLSFVVLLCFLL